MTVFHLAHKTELVVNDKQELYLKKACGCARFAYNWGLQTWKDLYEAHCKDSTLPKPNQYLIRRMLNAVKREQYPWMMEVTKCSVQMALIQLGQAFANFWKNPQHFHYPHLKKKYVNDSFTVSNDQFKVEGSRIFIPKLGWVKMRESLRFANAKLLWATLSRQGSHWYVSLTCELENLDHLTPAKNHGTVGVDMGIKHLAVLSNHKIFEAVMPLRKKLKKLKREQKKLSRCRWGSNNYQKQRIKVANIHRQIRNCRQNALHQLTHYLTSNFSRIVIEDLNVKGMLQNRKLALAIADVGLYEFRRQLLYKAALRGCEVIIVDRFYPSSKTCGYCGHKNENLTLSDRSWQCPHCHKMIENRDFNAALNLKKYTERLG